MTGLRFHSLRGLLWTAGQNLLVRGLSLVTFVILARILTPRDYGIVAIAGVFAALLSLLAAGGLSQALVQRATLDSADIDTAFWVSLCLGALLSVLFASLAMPLASFFGLPELNAVALALSPMLLAVSLGSTPVGLLQRQLRFDVISKAVVLANVAATIIGVAVALFGGGYWALVVQTVTAPVAQTLTLWIALDYRPGRHLSWRRARTLFATGRPFVGENALGFLNDQSDKFAIGRLYGTSSLGVYAVAYRIITILLDVLARSVQVVALPAFARLRSQLERAASSYEALLRVYAAIVLPTFAITAMNADDLVLVVFGEKWEATVPLLQILCIYGAAQAFNLINVVVLQALGVGTTALWLSGVATIAQLLLLLLLARYGVAWIAATYALRALLTVPVGLKLVAHTLRLDSTGRIVAALLAPLLASALLSATTVGLQSTMPEASAWIRGSLSIGAGCATYLLVMAVLGRSHLREVRGVLVTVRSARSAS